MERCHPLDYVAQMPRRTIDEVGFRDAVENKQMLLNESWSTYALRQGYGASVAGEERVKWATETWSEYEERVVSRAAHLDRYFTDLAAAEKAAQQASDNARDHSAKLVAHLMVGENAMKRDKLASINTLYVNFEERQLAKMANERADVEAVELSQRCIIVDSEKDARTQFEIDVAAQAQAVLDLLEARRREQEAEAQRLLEEQRRKAEELRILEENRKREAEALEKARRDAEEEAKRAERKRREEERKNKAKAEREARAKQTRAEEAAAPAAPSAAEEKPAEVVAAPSVVVPSAAVEAPPAAPSLPIPQFNAVATSSVAALFASLTSTLRRSELDGAYVIKVSNHTTTSSGPPAAQVIAHNGHVLGGDVSDASLAHLLGLSIVDPQALSLASAKLHAAVPYDDSASSIDGVIDARVEFVENVQNETRCISFAQRPKDAESLLLIPIDYKAQGQYLAAVCGPVGSFNREVITAFAKFVWGDVSGELVRLLSAFESQSLGQQAVDWLSITMACKNCYFATISADRNALTFVATSPGQKALIGHTLQRREELESQSGVSFALIDESIKTGQPEVAHISDVLDKSSNKVNGNPIRFVLGGAGRKGSLLLCPVLRPAHPGTGSVCGVLYADTMDDDKAFNKADEDIMRTTAALLAELLLSSTSPGGDASQSTSSQVTLAIEAQLGVSGDSTESPLGFLKHIWHKVNTDIGAITSNQLLELAKYNSPPPIIPITITATLLLALGVNPKKVELWDDARKRVKASLIEKIVAFDPTDPVRRKRAFFVRSRKITDGYSAHDVFTRGSYPASCFFTWTFVTILLRRSADALRKQSAGKLAGAGSIPLELLLSGAAPLDEEARAGDNEEDVSAVEAEDNTADGKSDDENN